MDKQQVTFLVEEYLNGVRTDLPIAFDSGKSATEQFQLHTVKRLKVAYDLFCKDASFREDFALALRDYLLVFKIDIQLPPTCIFENNAFGISRDDQSGRYFAAFQFPAYVNHTFAERAFLSDDYQVRREKSIYNLQTDPLIYAITGFASFKSLSQKLAVYGALNTPDGYTTLVSLPTGGGKSLITQTLSYQKSGLTIIIVPTVSLAIDQVRVAKSIIKSAAVESEIFSYSSGTDPEPIMRAIKNETARMLFISPEALINNQGFADVIKEANTTRYLKNIVIDEAHIVVDWGDSFRIDYQCLESWRKKLLLANPLIRTILLSATYERHCVTILKDFFTQDEKWIEVRCDSLRHEPHYVLVKAKSYSDKNKKMIELVRKLPHPMIIYVARPDDAADIKRILNAEGIANVRTFTGLTTGAKRKNLIDEWVDDQFEIMVATSAFGVGVDKSDVRTVLHMYIPQNPNAYYQELGRGGRDKLPCLSVMCIHPDDANISFQRISKRVMTTEKIIGRWNSMYNSRESQRIDNLNYIDTSIKPNYRTPDVLDDSPTSDADMNWNIYVLLLLRRYNLIHIFEVLVQTSKYVFVIEIQDDRLRSNDQQLSQLIDAIRSDEWDYHVEAFQAIKRAINHSEEDCWSEMFYETYDKVSEYCAGCNAHMKTIESDFFEFPLKSPIKVSTRPLGADQISLLSGAREIVVYSDRDSQICLIDALMEKRLAVLVTSEDFPFEYAINSFSCKKNVLILDEKGLHELVKRKNLYYVSGLIAVIYSGSPKEVYSRLQLVINELSGKPEIRIVHILPENVYFDWIGKAFSDLVDGPVLPLSAIIG